jgi:hypothetical protein
MDDGLDDGFASCRFLVRGVEEENRDADDDADDNDTAALDEASVMYGGMVTSTAVTKGCHTSSSSGITAKTDDKRERERVRVCGWVVATRKTNLCCSNRRDSIHINKWRRFVFLVNADVTGAYDYGVETFVSSSLCSLHHDV